MSLKPEVQEQVRECIIHYSGPSDDSCSAKMRYLFFRISNAIKALFSCSEWQRTVRSLFRSKPSLDSNGDVIYHAYFGMASDALRVVLDYHKEKANDVPSKVYKLFGDLGSGPTDKEGIYFSAEELRHLPLSVRDFVLHLQKFARLVLQFIPDNPGTGLQS